MSLDRIELNRKVRRLVELCCSLDKGLVRPANDGGPATGEQFATVFILNIDGADGIHKWADNPEEDPENPVHTVTETVQVHARMTVTIQFFRKDALLLANKLRDRLALTSSLQLMRSQGLGFISAKPVKDLSAVVNENWEGRAAVDIDFYVVSTETDVVATYGQFPGSIATDSSTGNSYTTPFEVFEP